MHLNECHQEIPLSTGVSWVRGTTIKILNYGTPPPAFGHPLPRLADTLIAQSCLDHDMPIVVRDRDFRIFATFAELKLLPA